MPGCTGPASVIVLDAFDATSVPEYVFVFPKLSIIDCVVESIDGNTFVDNGPNGVPVTLEEVTGLVVAPDNGEFESEFNTLPSSVDAVTTAFLSPEVLASTTF